MVIGRGTSTFEAPVFPKVCSNVDTLILFKMDWTGPVGPKRFTGASGSSHFRFGLYALMLKASRPLCPGSVQHGTTGGAQSFLRRLTKGTCGSTPTHMLCTCIDKELCRVRNLRARDAIAYDESFFKLVELNITGPLICSYFSS